MATASDFLRRIRENPADRTGLLVFADWLDEHGHPGLAAAYRVAADPRMEYAVETAQGPRGHVHIRFNWRPDRYTFFGIRDTLFEAVQSVVKQIAGEKEGAICSIARETGWHYWTGETGRFWKGEFVVERFTGGPDDVP